MATGDHIRVYCVDQVLDFKVKDNETIKATTDVAGVLTVVRNGKVVGHFSPSYWNYIVINEDKKET